MTQPLSPFRRGAENGFRFGAYMTVIHATVIGSSSVPLLNVVTLALLAGAPALLYMLMRRDRTAEGGLPTLGALWLDGLLTILCGAMLASAVLTVYLRWIDPDFLISNLEQAVALLEASGDPSSLEMADKMHTAISNGFSISPITFSMMLLWMAGTSGSLLSLVIAAIINHKHPTLKSSNF